MRLGLNSATFVQFCYLNRSVYWPKCFFQLCVSFSSLAALILSLLNSILTSYSLFDLFSQYLVFCENNLLQGPAVEHSTTATNTQKMPTSQHHTPTPNAPTPTLTSDPWPLPMPYYCVLPRSSLLLGVKTIGANCSW